MKKALIVLGMVAAAAASAAEPGGTDHRLGLLLAPKVGFFKTTTPLAGAAYAGAEVGFLTPWLGRKLALVVEGNWHQPRLSGTLSDPQLSFGGQDADGRYTLVERQLALMASAVLRLPLGPLTPYGGAGPGLYFHQVTVDAFGNRYVESQATPGFQALVGLEYSLGPGAAFLEAHYHFTQIGLVTTGSVNAGGVLAGSVGYRLEL